MIDVYLLGHGFVMGILQGKDIVKSCNFKLKCKLQTYVYLNTMLNGKKLGNLIQTKKFSYTMSEETSDSYKVGEEIEEHYLCSDYSDA